MTSPVDLVPCGYVITTLDGRIISVNRTFESVIGYSRDELVGGKRFDELLTGGGRIYHETHYAPLLRMSGSAREIALDMVCKDGTRLPVLVNAVVEYGADERPRQVHVAVFEALHRRKYERELLSEKRRAEASEARAVALAQTLQQTLIPPTPPAIPDLDVAARYRAAGDGTEVGGDFYDVFEIGTGEWIVALGDVRGKGVEAAVVTSLARHTLRAAAVREPTPARALATLNAALLRHDTDRSCSVALAHLVRAEDGWQVCLSTAGHPLPYARRKDGTVEAVGELGGTLLGVREEARLRATSVSLRPGDALLLYTDGVTDARDGAAFYDEEGIVEVLARPHGDAEELVSDLLADVMAFQHGTARDDIAIVAVRVPEG
ncbi:MAG TPA: SpoIIE family protein phosphatase [Jatrophihabitans sp.]|nr:SpoIIE family protein phosphatase [Jatrophihabitans sp.]